MRPMQQHIQTARTQASGQETEPDKNPPVDDEGTLTFWQVLGSALAAAFGVQSSRNRKRDFSQGKASHFIIMGIGVTAVFVLIMVGVVSWILP